jgi:hypothetical protein
MADALMERVTGQGTADAVPVQVNLVMTDRAIFNRSDGGSEEPAPGCGCVASTRGRAVAPWSPWTPARACSVRGIRRFLVLRDQICRTPWCNVPIRHADHVIPFEEGARPAPTTAKAFARGATTPSRRPGGTRHRVRQEPATRFSPSPRPGTATPADRQNHPAPAAPGHRRRPVSSSSSGRCGRPSGRCATPPDAGDHRPASTTITKASDRGYLPSRHAPRRPPTTRAGTARWRPSHQG